MQRQQVLNEEIGPIELESKQPFPITSHMQTAPKEAPKKYKVIDQIVEFCDAQTESKEKSKKSR